MRQVDPFEFPPEQQAVLKKARRLEYVSLAYIASAAFFLFLVMGSSQAMRTSWLEDMISLVPPLAFLIGSRIAIRRPTERFPYGTHSAVSVGYLAAALALLGMGGYLFFEGGSKLLSGERPTIGGFDFFGITIWAGWPMLAALAYTGIPSFFLGRAKLKLAPQIHDKALFADAEMMRADWMAELAAACGVLGVGFGFWWADGLAALLVSLDILRDGFVNVKAAVTDLLDEMPKRTDGEGLDPVPAELLRHIEGLDWVEKAELRMREEGHVFFGEAFVVPRTADDLPVRLARLAEDAKRLNWRIHELVVMPVGREALAGQPPKAAAGETDRTRRGLASGF